MQIGHVHAVRRRLNVVHGTVVHGTVVHGRLTVVHGTMLGWTEPPPWIEA